MPGRSAGPGPRAAAVRRLAALVGAGALAAAVWFAASVLLAAAAFAQSPPAPGAPTAPRTPGASVTAAPALPPIVGAQTAPLPPWRLATLPRQQLPVTRFGVGDVEGERALRVEAHGSYGNLVADLPPAPPRTSGLLAWRWRVDEPNRAADLRQRRTDDTTVKVCVLFDQPLARLPFDEALLMRLARQRTGEALPAATVCYVWDAREPADTVIDNPYSRRVRYLVLRGAESPVGAWLDERRDLAADFLRLFGDEARDVPRVLAVAVGADADNTGGHSLAHLARITLAP
jgi:hypothetical protein